MTTPGTTCTRRSTTVVLPVPDGADTTYRRPPASAAVLLDILDLLAHLLQLCLGRHDEFRHSCAFGLGAYCIHLAVHFLQQKVEFAPHGLLAVHHVPPMAGMGPQPHEFLAHVGPGHELHPFLGQQGLIE